MFLRNLCKKHLNLLSHKNVSEQIQRAKYICITGMEFEKKKNIFWLALLMNGNCVYFNQFRPNISLHYNKHMARCCLLYLIKQNCFLKTLLRILIIMTQVSLYMLSLLKLIWNCIIFM